MRNDLLSWETGHSINPQGFATLVLDAFNLSAEHTVQAQVDSLNWEWLGMLLIKSPVIQGTLGTNG